MEKHLLQVQTELRKNTAVLFDVREEEEWAAGHLEDAVLVPLSKLKNGTVPPGLDKDKKTYLHCRSGGRVKPARELLRAMGFMEVVPLGEGFMALAENGFATKTGL